MSHYIPARDGQFDAWAKNFTNVVVANPTEFGLSDTEADELIARAAAWTTKYGDAVAKRDLSHAATNAKDSSRFDFEEYIRNLGRQIQANPNVTNEERGTAGLPIHSGKRTPIGPPTTTPIGIIERRNALEHVLRISDSATPTRRAKPQGAAGCQIYLHVGESEPTGDGDFRFQEVVTRSSATISFNESQSGLTAWYRFRWQNAKGQTGPWSDVILGKIIA